MAKPRRLGPVQEGEVVAFGVRGEGIVRENGDAVFISGVYPGEKVRYCRVLEGSRDPRGVVESVVTPHPARRESPCAHDRPAGCGVCTTLQLEPQGAREIKLTEWRRVLGDANAAWPALEPLVAPSKVESGRDFVRFRVDAKGRLTLPRRRAADGSAAEGPKQFPIEACPALTPGLDELRAELDGRMQGAKTVAMRASPRTGQRLVQIEAEAIPKGFDPVGVEAAIVLSQGEKVLPLREHPWMEEAVGSLRLRVSWDARYRINGATAVLLADRVRTEVARTQPRFAVDLSAGVGALALGGLREVKRVVAAEASLGCLRDLTFNAKNARVEPGFSAVRTTGQELLQDLIATGEVPDFALLDAENMGLEAAWHELFQQIQPRYLMFFAREARTLVRDVGALEQLGYKVAHLVPVEGPRGSHQLEVCAILDHVSG